MTRTRQIEVDAQDQVVRSLRDDWGTPLGLHRERTYGGWIVIAAVLLAAAVSVIAGVLS